MPDHKFRQKQDRNYVLLDAKQRIIDLMENGQELPSVGIYDEPVRYFKANEEWCKIIFGWLDWLEDVAGWPDAEDDSHAGIQSILEFEEGIELPEFELDCGDVEDCLETSTIINNINTQITNINQNIEDIEHEQEAGGNPLPPNPDMGVSGNSVCRGSHHISVRLRDRMLEYYELASTLTLQEFVEALMSIVTLGFTPSTSFWQFVFTLSDPTLADDAALYIEQIQQAFFCANWDLEDAKFRINEDPTIPSNEKALWLSVLDLYRQGQIDEWGLIGTLDTTEYDCTDGCPWIVVFDFSGLYVPVGDETLIITGNSWTVVNGSYVAGTGYVGSGVMAISHDLPEQCSLHHYYALMAKGASMAACDARFWWKGVSGTGSEQYSAFIRILSNTYGVTNFTVLGDPVMSQAAINFDPFFGGSSGHKIGWVKLVGTGAYPQS